MPNKDRHKCLVTVFGQKNRPLGGLKFGPFFYPVFEVRALRHGLILHPHVKLCNFAVFLNLAGKKTLKKGYDTVDLGDLST
jgi:hypothetical protein